MFTLHREIVIDKGLHIAVGMRKDCAAEILADLTEIANYLGGTPKVTANVLDEYFTPIEEMKEDLNPAAYDALAVRRNDMKFEAINACAPLDLADFYFLPEKVDGKAFVCSPGVYDWHEAEGPGDLGSGPDALFFCYNPDSSAAVLAWSEDAEDLAWSGLAPNLICIGREKPNA